MADGHGVDVLEDGLRAEERSAELERMRHVWRAEAEKAAQYFSAIPGFGHPAPEVPVRQSHQPGAIGPDPAGAGPNPTTTGQDGKISGRGLLVRLRRRLGKRPHNEQPPSEELALIEESQPQSTRFHSSF